MTSDLQYFTLAGFTLNPEERATLNISLQTKKDEEKFLHIAFWGKIFGLKQDYFVAYAWREDPFDRKFFYSQDLRRWLQLPDVAVEDFEAVQQFKSRLVGDPAFEYQTATSKMNEEKRLAAIVASIHYDASTVPRGAYYRDAQHQLKQNPYFKGLSPAEFEDLSNYFYFRPGFNMNKKTMEERLHKFDESIDIFDSLDKDPSSHWTSQVEKGIVLLKNLKWPGFVFYHTRDPVQWGSFYFGSGQENANLPFMF